MFSYQGQRQLASFVQAANTGRYELDADQTAELDLVRAKISNGVNRKTMMVLGNEAEPAELFPHLKELLDAHKKGLLESIKNLTSGFHSIADIPLPEGFKLRPKQQRFLQKLIEYFDPDKPTKMSGFVKYPTGIGKTILIGLMIRALLEHNKTKCLVLSPRDKINEQNKKQITRFVEPDFTVKDVFDLRKKSAQGIEPDVTIGTYNFAARDDADFSRLGNYDVIFLDECHRSFGPGMLEFLKEQYPNALLIGLSATPYIGTSLKVGKMKSAFDYFEGEIDAVTLKEACEEGDLAPIRAMQIKVKGEDLAGQESDEDKNSKLNKEARCDIAVKIAQKIPTGEKTIIFAAGVQHAQDTAQKLKEAGFTAESVDGEDSDARTKIEAFNRGEIQYLVNSDLLIEGFDDEAIKHAIILRYTSSLWMYEQMIGRTARLDPNDSTKIATVWDVVGRHSGQCTIFGLSEFYNQHREHYLNGEVVFGPEELKNRQKEGNGDSREKGVTDFGEYAEMDEAILIEEVGRILIPRDEDYYRNSQKVRADLEAFALVAKRESGKDLNESSALERLVGRCSNGELVRFATYRRNAAAVLDGDYKTILKELKRIAGYDVKEYLPRDESYYRNPQNVEADLKAYAQKAGLTDIADLTTGPSLEQIRVICSNGEEVAFVTYRRHAAVALGIASTQKQANSVSAKVLEELKLLAGCKQYPARNKEYYSDSQKVKADLEAFWQESGLEDISQLTRSTFSKDGGALKALCQNGETVIFATYIIHAAIAYDLASDSILAKKKSQEAFGILLKIAGFEVKEFAPRTAHYYTPPENVFAKGNVFADLEAFAKEAGLESGIDLTTTNVGVIATCKNGETVRLGLYLNDAAVALGLAPTRNDGKKISSKVLLELKKIAGYEMKKYEPRDKAYYQNPEKVRFDLNAFAQVSGTERIEDITTSHVHLNFTCGTGEEMAFEKYLHHAGATLRLANSVSDAKSKKGEILQKLKQIVGIEVKKFPPRDADYFSNAHTVKTDLDNFAQNCGLENGGQLNSSSRITGTRATCVNGEEVTFSTYIKKAGLTMGVIISWAEADKEVSTILNMLKEFAGYRKA